MRILKLIIISIVSLLLIITIISLFIPSNIRIARAVHINSSKETVMEQLTNPIKWKNWYPDADSAKFFYAGGTIKGLVLDEEKDRFLTISKIKNDEVVAQYHLPNKKIITGWQVTPSLDTNSVTVQWYMDFHLHWYPWEKFSSFVFERVYNPQLEKGLNNLKNLLEK